MRGIKSCLVGYKFFLVIVTTLSLQIVARHCRCCVHTTFYIFLFYVHTTFFLFFILSSDFILRSHNFFSRLHFIFSLGCISFCVHTTFPLSGYYAVISISCVHPIFHIYIFFILISHCFSYFLFFLLHFIMRWHNFSSLWFFYFDFTLLFLFFILSSVFRYAFTQLFLSPCICAVISISFGFTFHFTCKNVLSCM